MKKPNDKKETIEAKLNQIIRLLMELNHKTHYSVGGSGGAGQGNYCGYLCSNCGKWVLAGHVCY